MPDHTPKSPDLIYDIGMHRGEDTEFYLRKGFRVVACEADPDNASYCREHFREFIEQGRLVLIEGAIVEHGGAYADSRKVRFYKNEAVSAWGTSRSDWAERNANLGKDSTSIEVDAVDIADVIRTHGMPHYMKVDIEGMDMVCVKALAQFAERPDFISIESDKTRFANIKREIDCLEKLGYNAFQAVEQSAIADALPPCPAREGGYVDHRFPEGSSGLFGAELTGEWKSRSATLFQYRLIRLGYYLCGDAGILSRWRFRGAARLRSLVTRILQGLTKADVPGWYDTHARHGEAGRIRTA